MFKGMARIGHGSKLSVSGRLTLGEHFFISAESSIIAMKDVAFGNNVLISWDVLIMDHDIHRIYDLNGIQYPTSKPVAIGNNVWIGCRSLLLKGVYLADGSIVAAGSTVTKSFSQEGIIIGGNPAKKIKENVRWKM
jgi:acetyltransferase-like isoleucine patch superfamily enzyme